MMATKQNMISKTLGNSFKKGSNGQKIAMLVIGGIIALVVVNFIMNNILLLAIVGVIIWLIYHKIKEKKEVKRDDIPEHK